MKRLPVSLVFGLFVAFSTHGAHAKWISEGEVCQKVQGSEPGCTTLVTSKGWFGFWGGKVTHFEVDSNGQPTGRVRVRVTWVSDETDYKCGQVLDFHYESELKDMTHRSLAMRECR